MKTRLIILAAMVAFLAPTTPAQRKAEVAFTAGYVVARITEPLGIDHYMVFEGNGISGPTEIYPTTLANCPTSHMFTIGLTSAHNHEHTVVWVDCAGTQHRWALPVPVSSSWYAGTPLAVTTPIGWGCGTMAPLGLDLNGTPTLGTNRSFVLTDIPAGTLFAAVYFSFSPHNPSVWNPGSPLAAFGIPVWECYAFIDPASAMLAGAASAPGASASFPLQIPAAPGLAGLVGYAQAVTLSPGENPAGLITSNGLSMVFAQ